MSLRALPGYEDLRVAPELAALAVLDAALAVTRAALIAENPELGCGPAPQGRAPPLYAALAALVIARVDELDDLLGWYRVAIEDIRREREREQCDDDPF